MDSTSTCCVPPCTPLPESAVTSSKSLSSDQTMPTSPTTAVSKARKKRHPTPLPRFRRPPVDSCPFDSAPTSAADVTAFPGASPKTDPAPRGSIKCSPYSSYAPPPPSAPLNLLNSLTCRHAALSVIVASFVKGASEIAMRVVDHPALPQSVGRLEKPSGRRSW